MMPAIDGAPRRVLPEGRFAGPMPWVIAIMMFLAVLAAAAALAISHAAGAMQGAIAGRITVQVVEANPDVRARQRIAVAGELRRQSTVAEVTEIGDAEVRDLLTPWLGSDRLDAELPVPALIDATLTDSSPAAVADIERTVKALAPGARVDRHADWLGPLGGLLDSLRWLAVLLVVLTAAATAAAVILGARAALDQHRATIDVMHLMGATDRQISRLFERRVAQDAISGAALGFVVAILALILIGWRISAVESALVGSGTLGWLDWLLIAVLPVAGVALAIGAARLTVLRSLARIL
ncbi:ABC transporter permease [Sphingomonas sp. SUN039]|uniref:cell division protein FtsX n=1 Tax=Sphingomonas sp. SUN039 TaxID=2937787 RepID=UPI0021643D36|nr:cell division protein [Sphingomonas sp. SUN039]UVO55169.1 cell division protein [Sphingomonas sp. SUN039]